MSELEENLDEFKAQSSGGNNSLNGAVHLLTAINTLKLMKTQSPWCRRANCLVPLIETLGFPWSQENSLT